MTAMTTDMIQHALEKDYNKANEIFGEIMGAKVTHALDQEQIRLADQIYNGAEEQLELDLEGESDDDEVDQEDDQEESSEDVEVEVGDRDRDD